MSDINAAGIAAMLSPAELRELRAVVATNGGGISTECQSKARIRIFLRLQLMGLVQGMSGRQWRVVHTREGLAVARAVMAEGAP